MSAPLAARWQAKANDGAILLSPEARAVAANAIRDLASSDRIAGDTPIRALAVQPHAVHALLCCPRDVLHLRVGRLKSRTATLLAFDPTTGARGKGTWSRGFWWARLADETMLERVAAFVDGTREATDYHLQ